MVEGIYGLPNIAVVYKLNSNYIISATIKEFMLILCFNNGCILEDLSSNLTCDHVSGFTFSNYSHYSHFRIVHYLHFHIVVIIHIFHIIHIVHIFSFSRIK